QSAESAFKLFAGKLRIDDHPIRVFERRRIRLVRDLAVQWDATDDLQPIPIRPQYPQIIVEAPDIVKNEDKRGTDLFNQLLRLKGREAVPAFRIGRMNRQTAIADRSAGIADAQIVNLMPVREPPHYGVHHPGQTGAVRIEADGYELDAGAGMTH